MVHDLFVQSIQCLTEIYALLKTSLKATHMNNEHSMMIGGFFISIGMTFWIAGFISSITNSDQPIFETLLRNPFTLMGTTILSVGFILVTISLTYEYLVDFSW